MKRNPEKPSQASISNTELALLRTLVEPRKLHAEERRIARDMERFGLVAKTVDMRFGATSIGRHLVERSSAIRQQPSGESPPSLAESGIGLRDAPPPRPWFQWKFYRVPLFVLLAFVVVLPLLRWWLS